MNLHVESKCPSWTELSADDVTVNIRNSFARGSREMGTGKVKSTRLHGEVVTQFNVRLYLLSYDCLDGDSNVLIIVN